MAAPYEIQRPGVALAFERMLASYAMLTDADRAALRPMLGGLQLYPPDKQVGRGGRCGEEPLVVVEGWIGAVEALEDGRRQIVALCVAGDVLDPSVDCAAGLTATTLTAASVMAAGALKAAVEAGTVGEGVRRAWRAARAAAAVRLVHQVVRLGRMSALERTAEFMLELLDRQRRAGLGCNGQIDLPLTQEVLADHLGLSVVHMNRTLQQLRREGLIVYRAGRVMVPDPDRLARAAPRAAA